MVACARRWDVFEDIQAWWICPAENGSGTRVSPKRHGTTCDRAVKQFLTSPALPSSQWIALVRSGWQRF